MGAVDIILLIVYVVLVIFLGLVMKSLNQENPLYQKYFMKGLYVKVFGGLAFAMVYTFYYDYGGDTVTYFHDASIITGKLFGDFWTGLDLLFESGEYLKHEHFAILNNLHHSPGTSEFVMVRLTAVINLFAVNNFFSLTILFSLFSFIGVWFFFRVFSERYPQIENKIAIAVLFIPSVFFWGSGIMKDSVVIGFLGILMYQIHALTSRRRRRLMRYLLILGCVWLIFSIKAYVIMSLVPAVLMWIVLGVKDRIQNKLIRVSIAPLLLIISLVSVAGVITLLGNLNEKYSLESFFDTANSMQTWHYVEGENTSAQFGRGSSYSLGDYEPTIKGTIEKFPAAVNVTLFRPYIWEVKNIAMLAAAIESGIILIYTVFIFLGLGFFRVIKLLSQDSFLFMCIVFAIFFAFAVGFTSYNFGALVRYKIPCIPFYLCALVILQDKVRALKKSKWIANAPKYRQVRYS